MTVHEAIGARRSVRAYQDKPIEEDKLRRVLEAGRLAPSARNMQEWKFVVVRDRRLRGRLVSACKGQAFVAEAPVVIAACATKSDHIMTCGQYAYSIDLAIAVDHMTLAAVQEGLGTCWLGAFHEDEVREVLGIPPDVRVVAVLPVGYPAEAPRARSRNPFEEVFCFDRYA